MDTTLSHGSIVHEYVHEVCTSQWHQSVHNALRTVRSDGGNGQIILCIHSRVKTSLSSHLCTRTSYIVIRFQR